jgi:hypothetical protein
VEWNLLEVAKIQERFFIPGVDGAHIFTSGTRGWIGMVWSDRLEQNQARLDSFSLASVLCVFIYFVLVLKEHVTCCKRSKRASILPYATADLTLLLQTSGVFLMPLDHPVTKLLPEKKLDKYQFFYARIIWGQIAFLNLIGFRPRILSTWSIHLVAWACIS